MNGNRKQRSHSQEHHFDETWLIPYADLLTLLLALFIVLFAAGQIDTQKFEQLKMSFNAALSGGKSFFSYNTPVPADKDIGVDRRDRTGSNEEEMDNVFRREETRELLELKDKIDEYIERNGLTAQLETHLDERQLRITISDHALFDSGSARLKPESVQLANALSELLEQYPDFEVIVAGHTDNVPINTPQFPSNFHLSAERALSFMSVLLQNPNVGEHRFSSVGYGEYRPVATNDTPEGRALNRRVEVSIIRNIP